MGHCAQWEGGVWSPPKERELMSGACPTLHKEWERVKGKGEGSPVGPPGSQPVGRQRGCSGPGPSLLGSEGESRFPQDDPKNLKTESNQSLGPIPSLLPPCLGSKLLVFSFSLNTSCVRGAPSRGTTGVA